MRLSNQGYTINEEWQELRDSGIIIAEIAHNFKVSKSMVTRNTVLPKNKAEGYSIEFRLKAVQYKNIRGPEQFKRRYKYTEIHNVYNWAKEFETGTAQNYDDNRFIMPTKDAAMPAMNFLLGKANGFQWREA